jgi:hypothetical protein
VTSWPGSDPVNNPGYEPVYATQPMPGYLPPGVPPAPPPPAPRTRRSARLWAVIGVLAVLAAASVAVAATAGRRTVSGTGAALGSPAAPSAPPSSSSVHTLPPSTSSTADWVLITDAQAHLRVRMPGQPDVRSQSGGLAGTTYTVNVAVAHADGHPVEAACEDVTTPLTTDAAKSVTLRAGVAGFGVSSGLDKISDSATTYRGNPARTADFNNASGRVYTLLIFFHGDSRLYFLFAERGTPFDTLSSSLQILP